MKALTLMQPMAHAIVALPSHFAKDVENRIWQPPSSLLGQRFAIHAGLAWGAARYPWPADVPVVSRADCEFGCVVGVATLLGWFSGKQGERLCHEHMADICSPNKYATMVLIIPKLRWWLGPVGWLLGHVQRLPESIPCRGYQKLWNLPKLVEDKVLEQLGSGVNGPTPIEEAQTRAGDQGLRGGAGR